MCFLLTLIGLVIYIPFRALVSRLLLLFLSLSLPLFHLRHVLTTTSLPSFPFNRLSCYDSLVSWAVTPGIASLRFALFLNRDSRHVQARQPGYSDRSVEILAWSFAGSKLDGDFSLSCSPDIGTLSTRPVHSYTNNLQSDDGYASIR